jgi:F0F1-type ATP synthase beta subunit
MDEAPEQAFNMVGNIDEVKEKAKKIQDQQEKRT